MKNFVTAEEFLKLPDDCQNEIITWWKPTIGDLWFDSNNENEVRSIYDESDISYVDKYKFIIAPLLSVDQLLSFFKVRRIDRIEVTRCDAYSIWLYEDYKLIDIIVSDVDMCLLEALWLAVLEFVFNIGE